MCRPDGPGPPRATVGNRRGRRRPAPPTAYFPQFHPCPWGGTAINLVLSYQRGKTQGEFPFLKRTPTSQWSVSISRRSSPNARGCFPSFGGNE